jgi:ubiquinone/menaquinone biosynthesis C-methylase UbiE
MLETNLIERIRVRLGRRARQVRASYRYYVDIFQGRRSGLTPPPHKNFVGDGDFEGVGELFLRRFVDLGGLRPSHRVLDVGCGLGRMAAPLTRFLTTGSYEGFDIVPEGIKWCKTRITPKYPNFRFVLADIYNKAYHPRGKLSSLEYRFPYRNKEFDFVCLTSVFTHMLTADMKHYLSEISRTMKPGGRCLITYFLINPESLELIREGRSLQEFRRKTDGYYTTNPATPEASIAFDEDDIRQLYAEYGLRIVEPIHYGSWCGRTAAVNYQDIIVAEKQ